MLAVLCVEDKETLANIYSILVQSSLYIGKDLGL